MACGFGLEGLEYGIEWTIYGQVDIQGLATHQQIADDPADQVDRDLGRRLANK
jgi:hypothetical protein